MKKLLRYLRGSALTCAIIAPLLMVLEVMMDLQQPTLMSNIIDVGIRNGDMQYVWTAGLKMLGCALIGIIGGAGCTVFSSIASVKMAQSLRANLFARVQTFSFKEVDKFRTSSLITRLTNDVTQVQNMVLSCLRMLVRAPMTCIGGIVYAIVISAKLSWILAVATPLLIVAMVLVIRKAFPLFGIMQDKIDGMNDVMRENLLGIRVTKAFVSEKRQLGRFDHANEDLLQFSVRASRLTVLLWPVIDLVVNGCIVAVFLIGGKMVMHGELELGKIMAYISYIGQILGSLTMTVMFSLMLSRAKASADRINEVFATETSISDAPDAEELTGTEIEFRHVSFKYPASNEYALQDLNFTIHEGESVGIIGATGSGKSSIVQLIPRLYDTTEGEVCIGGKNVKKLRLSQLRGAIGMVLQDSILFSGTVEDSFRFGKADATEEEIRNAAADAQALEFIEQKPEGFRSTVEQRARNFSGGQKQRLSIARTLTRSPKILILDDSTSAVDLATEAKLQAALRRRMGSCTLIVIAQRISGVMDADKILVVDDGRIVDAGTHQELLKTSEIYRSIAVSQLGEEVLENA